MPTKREIGLSQRHAVWTPAEVAGLLEEYRVDMAQAARQHYEYAAQTSEPTAIRCDASHQCGECDAIYECGANCYVTPETHSRALLTFADRVTAGEMFLTSEERKDRK